MSMGLPPTEGKRIKSLETGFEIIERIGRDGPVTRGELEAHLDLSKSTVHYYLRTLESGRYVVRSDEGYRLGLRCLELGGLALEQRGSVQPLRTDVDRLADETEQTAVVAVEEGGKSVVVYRAWPADTETVDCRLGAEHHLHATAWGKAILGHLPDEDVDAVVEYHGLPARTDHTITDRETLAEERETTRTQEVAFADGERVEGVRSIAAPIIREDGTVYGAVGIVGPAAEIDDPFVHSKAKRFEESPSNIVKRFAHIMRNKLGED
jgi:DNA-binding IclR family transcriptional regulator